VLDAFHVVRLGTQVVDEVRRRVQQDTLGYRGHKDDPLYKIRGLLRHGVEHLTERQHAKISACLDAGDPTAEVNVAWQCYQQLRSIYHAAPAKGREIAIKVLDSFHTCPIPEVARLGRSYKPNNRALQPLQGERRERCEDRPQDHRAECNEAAERDLK
jgi:transposase